MGFFDLFRRRAREPDRLTPGRHTAVVTNNWGMLSPHRSRTTDVLQKLRAITDEADALDYLRKVNPDVSMAVWNFIRLSNQGHKMEFYGVNTRNKGTRLEAVEAEWRDFASRVNELSNAGLDGLMDQLHYAAFMKGAQGLEVEVAGTLDDVVDVYAVDPRTIDWRYEERNGRKVWVPYQRQSMKTVDLYDANFFWVPTDPNIDDPRGNLVMGSVLQAIDFQMQVLQDLQAVIHHQGWPRQYFKFVMERMLKNMPSQVRTDPKKQKEWIEARVKDLQGYLRELGPDDDFIFTDDIEMGKSQGGEVTRSVDIRAMGEMLDVQTMSGLKQLAVFLNRVGGSGTTEAWSTVQFRVFTSGIRAVQRGSKRLMEEVARLWLRTRGIQARPYFEHETIDWQSEIEKQTLALMQQEFWVISQLMGWSSPDESANRVIGRNKAHSQTPSEAVKASLSLGGSPLGKDRRNDHDSSTDGDNSGRLHSEVARDHGKDRRLRVFGGRGSQGGD